MAWGHPEHIQRKIDLREQRARHRREAPKGCDCLICRPERDVTAELLERVRVNSERIGEAPF